nr:translation initiation factor IF-2-like [Symphalangus syndactylus]
MPCVWKAAAARAGTRLGPREPAAATSSKAGPTAPPGRNRRPRPRPRPPGPASLSRSSKRTPGPPDPRPQNPGAPPPSQRGQRGLSSDCGAEAAPRLQQAGPIGPGLLTETSRRGRCFRSQLGLVSLSTPPPGRGAPDGSAGRRESLLPLPEGAMTVLMPGKDKRSERRSLSERSAPTPAPACIILERDWCAGRQFSGKLLKIT